MAAAASSRGCPRVRPTMEAEASLREGPANPGLSRGSPRRAGEAIAPAGHRRGVRLEQNTQAQRARLCWSILFSKLRVVGWWVFFVSSLNITKRALYSIEPGRSRSVSGAVPQGPGRAGLPTTGGSGSGLLGALSPGSRAVPCRASRRPVCGDVWTAHQRDRERGSYGPAD